MQKLQSTILASFPFQRKKSLLRKVHANVYETSCPPKYSNTKLQQDINTRFQDRALVVNFSSKPFHDLQGAVLQDFAGATSFEDIPTLLTTSKAIASWIAADANNVVVLHADQEPAEYTLLSVVYYLYFINELKSKEVSKYVEMFPKCKHLGLLTHGPSVIRYAHYCHKLLTTYQRKPSSCVLRAAVRLVNVQLSCQPFTEYRQNRKTMPYVCIRQSGGATLFLGNRPAKFQNDVDEVLRYDVGTDLVGDFCVVCYYEIRDVPVTVFRLALNTAMLERSEYVFRRQDLDYGSNNRLESTLLVKLDVLLHSKTLVPLSPRSKEAKATNDTERYCVFPEEVRKREAEYRQCLMTLLECSLPFVQSGVSLVARRGSFYRNSFHFRKGQDNGGGDTIPLLEAACSQGDEENLLPASPKRSNTMVDDDGFAVTPTPPSALRKPKRSRSPDATRVFEDTTPEMSTLRVVSPVHDKSCVVVPTASLTNNTTPSSPLFPPVSLEFQKAPINAPPPPPVVAMTKGVPPPPPPSSTGSKGVPPPPPPSTGSKGVPPPPPPSIAGKGVPPAPPSFGPPPSKVGAPPPPPPPFTLAGGVPPPPPPMKGAGGVPPPPPMFGAQSNVPKSSTKQLHWEKVGEVHTAGLWAESLTNEPNDENADAKPKKSMKRVKINMNHLQEVFSEKPVNETAKESAKKETASTTNNSKRIFAEARSRAIEIALSKVVNSKKKIAPAELRKVLLTLNRTGEAEGRIPDIEMATLFGTVNPTDVDVKALDTFAKAQKGCVNLMDLPVAERYVYDLATNVQRLRIKIQCFVDVVNWEENVKQLEGLLCMMERAVDGVRHATAFQASLHAILDLGNEMNRGRHKGCAKGFRVSGLMSVVATKANDGKTSLLDFLVGCMIKDSHPGVDEMVPSLQSVTDRVTKTPLDIITDSAQKLSTTLQRIQTEYNTCRLSTDAGCQEYGKSLAQFLDNYAKYFTVDITDRTNELIHEAKALLSFYGAEDMKLEDFLAMVRSYREAFATSVKKQQTLAKGPVRPNLPPPPRRMKIDDDDD